LQNGLDSWIGYFWLYNFGFKSIFGFFGVSEPLSWWVSFLGHYAFGPKWKFLVFALIWAQIDRSS